MPAVEDREPMLSPLVIRRGLGISQEAMSQLLRVSAKTVSRWEKEQGQPRAAEQLARLAKLKEISELGQAVYTPEGFREFLSAPLSVFTGRTGFELLHFGECEPVIAALAADFEGTGF